MRRLEKYIEKQLPYLNAFVPTGGGPGPEVVDVAPLVETLAFSVSYHVSPANSLVQFGLGFRIDK